LADSFFKELKRRNVYKVGVAYLVLGWLIIEIADTIFPQFQFPPWTNQFVIFLIILGFPIAIFLAWAFEITPEGIKKESEIAPEDSIAAHTGQKLNYIIIVLLVLVSGYFFYESRFITKPEQAIETKTTSEKVPAKLNVEQKAIRRIAVLPFFNNKPDPATDYFGFAIADQIIGDLIYLKNIVVRPSSSVRIYDKKVVDSAKVGKDLNTDYILVGSYLKEANRIRLKVEMVDVNTNELIWREPIEVDYKNAFELQDLVAKKVVQKLNIQFSDIEMNNIGKSIPANSEAYDLYLQSISIPISGAGNQLALEQLEKSIQLDPAFAPTYSEMGKRLSRLAVYEMMGKDKLQEAENLYLKALTLDENLLSALTNLSTIYTDTGRTEQAVDLIKKVLAINPNYANAHFSLGYIFRYTGMIEQSIKEMETAISIEPYNPAFRSLGVSYMTAGEYDKAIQFFKRDEETSFAMSWLAEIYFRQEDYEQSLHYQNKLIDRNPDNLWGLYSLASRNIILGHSAKALENLSKLKVPSASDAEAKYFNASLYAKLGNQQECASSLRSSIEKGYFNYPFMMRDEFLEVFYDDPEIKAILQIAKQKHLDFKSIID